MSLLQNITHRFPPWVQKPLISLIGQECYTILVWNTDFRSTECIKYSLSKGLGLGIVLGGSIVKVPQIIKIVKAGNARGLSLSSYLLDTASLAVTVAYNVRHNFPLSTYGENVFLLAQNIVITFLIVALSRTPNRSLLLSIFALIFGLTGYALSSPLIPLKSLQLLAASCIPLSLASKIPQIVSNHTQKSTGQLSAFLVFNSLAGCLARVFTTATETGDPVLYWGFLLAAILNGVLALQMALYWNSRDNSLTTPLVVPEKEKRAILENKGEAGGVEKIVENEREKIAQSPVARTASPSTRRYVRKLD